MDDPELESDEVAEEGVKKDNRENNCKRDYEKSDMSLNPADG